MEGNSYDSWLFCLVSGPRVGVLLLSVLSA